MRIVSGVELRVKSGIFRRDFQKRGLRHREAKIGERQNRVVAARVGRVNKSARKLRTIEKIVNRQQVAAQTRRVEIAGTARRFKGDLQRRRVGHAVNPGFDVARYVEIERGQLRAPKRKQHQTREVVGVDLRRRRVEIAKINRAAGPIRTQRRRLIGRVREAAVFDDDVFSALLGSRKAPQRHHPRIVVAQKIGKRGLLRLRKTAESESERLVGSGSDGVWANIRGRGARIFGGREDDGPRLHGVAAQKSQLLKKRGRARRSAALNFGIGQSALAPQTGAEQRKGKRHSAAPKGKNWGENARKSLKQKDFAGIAKCKRCLFDWI